MVREDLLVGQCRVRLPSDNSDAFSVCICEDKELILGSLILLFNTMTETYL
jgi:hypothetical protein